MHGSRAAQKPAGVVRDSVLSDVVRVCNIPGGSGSTAAAPATTGLGIMRRDPLLRTLLLLLGLFAGLGSMVNVVDVFLVRGTLHASATWYGVSGAALAVGMLVASVTAGRLRGDGALARWFVISLLVLAAGLLGSAAVPNVYALIPLSALIGAANGVLNVTLGSLVMGRAAAEVRGRVAAALSGIASAAQLAAYVLGGALGVALTPREIFAIGGGLGLLAPLVLGRRLIRATAPLPQPSRVAADWAA